MRSKILVVNIMGLDTGGGKNIADHLIYEYLSSLSNLKILVLSTSKKRVAPRNKSYISVVYPNRIIPILSDQIAVNISCILFQLRNYSPVILNLSDIPILSPWKQILFFDWAYAVIPQSDWGAMSRSSLIIKSIKKLAFRMLHSCVDQFVAQTPFMRERLIASGIPDDNIKINPIGIGIIKKRNSSFARRESQASRNLLKVFKQYNNVIFCPNSFNAHKGYRFLSLLLESGLLESTNSLLVILAPNYLLAKLNYFKHHLLVNKNFIALGSVQPSLMTFLYQKSSIVFNPSQLESFGFAYYEAAYYGKRQVVPDLPHVPIFARGYTYTCGRTQDMVDKVYSAISDYNNLGDINPCFFKAKIATLSEDSVINFVNLINNA